jgi:DNA-binding transcriptional regulator/RsmH inhibitor MraZ
MPWGDMTEPFYAGTFCHRLDEKNRVTIPAKWRLMGTKMTHISPGPIPKAILSSIRPKKSAPIARKNQPNPRIQSGRTNHFTPTLRSRPSARSRFTGSAKTPEELLKTAHIETDVILIGLGDRINIQAKSAYDSETSQKVNLLELMKEVGYDRERTVSLGWAGILRRAYSGLKK